MDGRLTKSKLHAGSMTFRGGLSEQQPSHKLMQPLIVGEITHSLLYLPSHAVRKYRDTKLYQFRKVAVKPAELLQSRFLKSTPLAAYLDLQTPISFS